MKSTRLTFTNHYGYTLSGQNEWPAGPAFFT